MTSAPSLTDRSASAVADALSLEQQAGLLFHPMIFLGPTLDLDSPSPVGPSLRELIVERGIRFLCIGGMPAPAVAAPMLAELQDLARGSGSGLPLVFSTDPRHSFLQNDGASHRAAGVSQWPEPIGLGAIGDPALVKEFAEVIRHDYRAIGIRLALHPQVDLATEPRWARQAQSFSSDSDTTCRLLRAFLDGLHGDGLETGGIAATVKHFPGGGPQLDGEDPHFPYGREQVYPGGRFADHLAPFRTAIDAGASVIMPYYGMPVGLSLDGEPVEHVGFAFNRRLITGLLRDELGFDGVVLSDFGIVNDAEVFGLPLPARAWGLEEATPDQRLVSLFEAGVDQLGGEADVSALVRLVEDRRIDRSRIRESAERVIALLLRLTPEDRRAAPEAQSLPRAAHVERGFIAQAQAVTVLDDRAGLLPLPSSARKVHLRGLAADALPEGWSVHETADAADLAIVRLRAPFEKRNQYFLEAGMEQGSLDFDAETIDAVLAVAREVPTVVVVTLSRPAILTPFAGEVATLCADFGASDAAVIASLTHTIPPLGRLPFELPRSMDAVAASRPDVASDTRHPLYPRGWNAAASVEVTR